MGKQLQIPEAIRRHAKESSISEASAAHGGSI
jgi:hypothetical protein